MSATLSTKNIIDSKRRSNSKRVKRLNPRNERAKKQIDYSIYYNSSDSDSDRDKSPLPRKGKSTAEISLREPTAARLHAQTMITRKRLQDLSPDSTKRTRLIGTVTSPRPLLFKPTLQLSKHKIKKETIVKSEKDAEIADYLAKGLCLSAHTDGTPCANIQNPNNVNVKPMGIREHRRKQRTEKAIFEAHMKARKDAQRKGTLISQSGNNNNINIKASISSPTELNKDKPTAQTLSENILAEVMSTFQPVNNNSHELFIDINENNDEISNNGIGVTANNESKNIETENDRSRNVVTQKQSSLPKNVASQPNSKTQKQNKNGVTEDCITTFPDTNPMESIDEPQDMDMSLNLDDTIDYTDEKLDSETEELMLNKNNPQTYSHSKNADLSKQSTTTAPEILPQDTDNNLNIDIEMEDDIDIAKDMCSLSDNLADNLVITDLEELMNENEILPQTAAPLRPNSPKGTFTYRFQGLRRKPSMPVSAGENKYKCPSCSTAWNTRGEMCEHYRKTHPPLPCAECEMTFTSPLSLARHGYKHKERPYECEVCGEQFAFNSELTQHTPVHKETGSFFCMANNCGRKFMRQGELNAHALTHTGPLIRCNLDPACQYSTRNPRLYRAHTNTHTRKKKYPCRICKKEFDYTQQVKRHRENEHT